MMIESSLGSMQLMKHGAESNQHHGLINGELDRVAEQHIKDNISSHNAHTHSSSLGPVVAQYNNLAECAPISEIDHQGVLNAGIVIISRNHPSSTPT